MQVKQLSSYGNKYLISDTRSHLVTETSTVITLEIFTVIGRPTIARAIVMSLSVCCLSVMCHKVGPQQNSWMDRDATWHRGWQGVPVNLASY